MIKLFCSDLDNTLLINNVIPQRNRDALLRLQDAGVEVLLVSGRLVRSLEYLSAKAEITTINIGTNGAIGKEGEKIFYQKAIPKDLLCELLNIAEEEKVYFHLYDADTFYAKRILLERVSHLLVDRDERGDLYQCNFAFREDLRDVDALKLQFRLNAQEEKRVMERLDELPHLSVTSSYHGIIEIMNEEVNKWETIRRYAQMKGIEPHEIAAIGDFMNDYEMIKESGIGFAVGNAVQKVKDAADYVVKPFDSYGVEEAASILLKEERRHV